MQAGLSPAREARARCRHEVLSLLYVTLDETNGGIIRNLTHEGMAVQAVVAVRPGQRLRVRFELPRPRLRVDTRGEVVWAEPGGRCGVRFLDLSPRVERRIDEWIFGNLLESAPLHSQQVGSMFPSSRPMTTPLVAGATEDDGLMISPAVVKVIELPSQPGPHVPLGGQEDAEAAAGTSVELDWLSRPLSSRGIAWLVNTLTVVAALLLFTLVFLAVARELPRWPVAMATGATIFVAAAYWGFFKLFGGISLGARLARLAGYEPEDEEPAGNARFR